MNARTIVALAAAALLLGACGEDSATATDPTGSTGASLNEIVTTGPINASSTDTLVYFSFADNALVPRAGAWDIALRRYEVRLNGGVTGTGGVTGYSVGNNRTATGAQVLAFTNTNTLAAFDSLRDAQIPVDSVFRADRLILNATGFMNLNGVPTANGTQYWKVRTAGGGYALMRVTAITLNAQYALTSVSFEARTQAGTTLGAPVAFTITTGSAPVLVNLASGAAVTASGCNWDIQITPQAYELGVNAACNVGTYPGASSPAFASATSASDAAEYAPYLAGLTGPVPNSIEDAQAPFRYNLSGDNRLSPSFNTYLIRNGTKVYKLQVIGYYSAAGAGGWPTIRFARIR